MMVFEFETTRCFVRPFTAGDIDAFMSYRNDGEWMKYQGFKGLTKREYEEILLVRPDFEKGVQLAVIAKETGILIGDLYFKREGDACWLGYTITPQKARQGYIYEVAKAAVEWICKQGIDQIKAGVEPGNGASVALLQKLGFTYTGMEAGERVYNLIL